MEEFQILRLAPLKGYFTGPGGRNMAQTGIYHQLPTP